MMWYVSLVLSIVTFRQTKARNVLHVKDADMPSTALNEREGLKNVGEQWQKGVVGRGGALGSSACDEFF